MGLVLALSVVAVGILSSLGPFWALPTAFLKEQAAAGGIAFINSCGALGGFVGPYLLGVVKDRTGSFNEGLVVLSGLLLAAAGVVLGMRVSHLRRIVSQKGRGGGGSGL